LHQKILSQVDVWSPEILALLIVSGFAVGVINTLAGSGTAINYWLFLWLGMPPSMANGTIRIGVITQTLAASLHFYRTKILHLKDSMFVAIPITIGSIAGAEVAININPDVFKNIIGVAMLIMMFFMFYKPENWIKSHDGSEIKNKWWHLFLYFAIGFYGGFIHIGVGIFLLAALVLASGYNLLYANSLKVFIVLIYTPFTLFVFIYNNDIHYLIGFISAVGNTLGGIVASKYAIKHGVIFLRWFLAVVIVSFSGYLFGIYQIIFDYFEKIVGFF